MYVDLCIREIDEENFVIALERTHTHTHPQAHLTNEPWCAFYTSIT